MTEAEKDRLVAEWIEFQSIPLKDRSRECRKQYEVEGCRALDVLDSAGRDDPELAWELILRIHRAEHNENVTIMLAAGALEDLLAAHGENFIERVETEARKDQKFNFLLGGVWRNSMIEGVWERVQNVRREVW